MTRPLYRCLFASLAWLLLALALPAQAQQLGLPGLAGGGEEARAEHDPQTFQASLVAVIATLEDAERRGALLESLRELQAVHGEATVEATQPHRQGLLGALAETLSDLGDQAEAGYSPIDQWQDQLEQGWEDLSGLVSDTDNADLMRFLVEGAVLQGIWAGL
ncbi:MAG: mechanosensitive ion channel family protein, partial [Halomonas sp. BM-2019]